MNNFSQNTSAFNCGLITFQKPNIGRVPPVWFHGNKRIIADHSCL